MSESKYFINIKRQHESKIHLVINLYLLGIVRNMTKNIK